MCFLYWFKSTANSVTKDCNGQSLNTSQTSIPCRLETLKECTTAVVILSKAYLHSEEFGWEATMLRMRALGSINENPFNAVILKYEEVVIPEEWTHIFASCSLDFALQQSTCLWEMINPLEKVERALQIIQAMHCDSSDADLVSYKV